MLNSQSERWLKKLKPLKEQIPALQFDIAICGLFLLRHLNEVFEEQKAKIAETYGVEESEDEDYYYENAQCFLRKEAQWAEIIRLSKDTNIGVLLDNAFKSLEESNKHVKGVLPSGFFLNSVFQPKDLNAFIVKVSNIYETTEKEEFIEIFQDFLNQCAIQRSKVEEDKKYTPLSIAKLLVALADPYEGNIYDPCFGTAGLLVEATKYIRNQKEKMDNVFFFGQELATDIHQFAKINQAINRCEFKLGEPRNTFSFDLFRNKKMDYILANFPMNKKVEEGKLNSNDERWIQFGMPCNENCAWIQHIIHHLSEEGIAVFLVPQKELDSTGNRRLRKGIIEADLVEAVIILPKNSVYKDISQLAILVINKNKREKVEIRGDKSRTYRKRIKEILFIDAREDQKVKRGGDPHITKEKSEWVIEVFNSWRCVNPELMKNFQKDQLFRNIGLEEIRNKDYSLSMAQYIETISKEEEKKQKIEDTTAEKRQIAQSLLALFKQEEYWKEEFKKIIEEQEKESKNDEEF